MTVILVRSLYETGKETIIDMRVTNIFAASYRHRSVTDTLAQAQRDKNGKHRANCKRVRREFIPFIASCNGNVGPLAERLLQRIAAKLSEKWEQPYSVTIQFVRNRVSLSLARSMSHCVRGSRIPASCFSYDHFAHDEAAGIFSMGLSFKHQFLFFAGVPLAAWILPML